MSVVVGTAGHIDHGKTALLRALTGIDADRLPEERRRGMTIDVGYAHLALPDGSVLDLVDVPGHDRLVGNMLVGAGEIDAALLVVAADDGPNDQTLEHLELLDALGIADGLAVITKADLVPDAERRAAMTGAVTALLAGTTLAGSPVLLASSVSGEGLDEVRDALVALAARVSPRLRPDGAPRLAIDRVFGVRGRGSVVTGSLRGGRVTRGMTLRPVPDGTSIRVREVQVRGHEVDASDAGRTALLLGGIDAGRLRRGMVLTADPRVLATSRLLVAVRAAARLAPRSGPVAGIPAAPADRARLRLHLGTAQADALVVRGPREAIDLPDGSSLAILRLDGQIAAAPGDRFALRAPSPGGTAGGGLVLDPVPPRGISRRRLTAERAAALAEAAMARDDPGVERARLDLHGALPAEGGWRLAADVEAALARRARDAVAAHHAADPGSPGLPLAALRAQLAREARRMVTLTRAAADEVVRGLVEGLIASGQLARGGDTVRDPARAGGLSPATIEAMERLERALSVATPPSLARAARDAGCPVEGLRALEAAGRIVRVEDDLAWSSATYRQLAGRAVTMAATAALTPAAFRDATGTSRRYVLAILGDLDRRELLRRTDAGHVLGPRTLARLRQRAAAASGSGPSPEGDGEAG